MNVIYPHSREADVTYFNADGTPKINSKGKSKRDLSKIFSNNFKREFSKKINNSKQIEINSVSNLEVPIKRSSYKFPFEIKLSFSDEGYFDQESDMYKRFYLFPNGSEYFVKGRGGRNEDILETMKSNFISEFGDKYDLKLAEEEIQINKKSS